MIITLQDAIQHLYNVAVVNASPQSTSRLRVLAEFAIQELATRGIVGALPEQTLPGGGREKSWDVAWEYDGKFRLAMSLKSMLKNLGGTVPNRVDDLIGEVANAQLHSPEIVLGYLMIVDVSQDVLSPKHGSTWFELLNARLTRLAGRRAPHWTIGTIEAFALVQVDFSQSALLLTNQESLRNFFDILAEQVRARNPNAMQPRIVREIDNS